MAETLHYVHNHKISMGFIAEALWLLKMNRFDSAAKLLEQHLADQDLKPSSKISIMALIGDCCLKLEDRGRAAQWYELSGKTALECTDIPQNEREKRAMHELEQALDYYEAVNDIQGMSRVAPLKYALASGTNS